jgi:hypothetical protein
MYVGSWDTRERGVYLRVAASDRHPYARRKETGLCAGTQLHQRLVNGITARSPHAGALRDRSGVRIDLSNLMHLALQLRTTTRQVEEGA